MKYLHLYNSQTDYDNKKNTLILPSASLIEENNHVEYNPHHDFVEIAGIKWATMNVGAKSITDTGLYFQWGDTQGYTKNQVGRGENQKEFARDWSDYKWYDKENSTSDTPLFTKYNGTDGYTELALEDDAVHAAWGGSWRLPTIEEFEGIGNAVANGTVVKQLATKNDVYGILLAEGDKELFLPACGLAYDGSVDIVGSGSSYWLSSLGTDDFRYAYYLGFNSDDVYVSSYYRYNGLCVRGVLDD